MYKHIDKIEKFDFNKKTAFIIMCAIIGSWASISYINDLDFEHEDCMEFGHKGGSCTDYGMRLMYMINYEDHRFENPLRSVTFELLYYSKVIFDDYRIIPFISSGFVLILTYLITQKLTNRYYTGIIAVLFVLHSPIFYKYDLTMTYPNFWVSFFLASIYFSLNAWALSPLMVALGMPSKIINILNFPATVIFGALADSDNKTKTITVHLSILAILVSGLFATKFVYPPIWNKVYSVFLSQFNFQPMEFVWWLGMWAVELFTDKITLFMVYIMLMSLFLLRKQKVKNSSALLAMIIIIILQPAFISGFTEYTNEDYRFLHLVCFVGISLGFVVSNVRPLINSFSTLLNGSTANKK